MFKKISLKITKNTLARKAIALVIIVSILLPLFIFTPLKTVLDATLFKSFIKQYQGYVEIIFIGIYTVLTVIGVPGTILTIVGGCLFGLWYGTAISIVSASLGALCAFLTARYLLQDFAQRKFSKNRQLNKFQTAVLDRPFSFVLTTRLIPISPFNLVNYLFGLTTINWWDYTRATFIGVIPGSFAYTWIGVSGEQAMMGGDRLSFLMALTFLALLSIIPLLYQPKKRI
ncbi:TVP38/TMEM64 family protein [Waterburya agarophytonicola K14]|uniref:TVP38/TMEM64 family membrane protein n=1 Tax=Waterburya agarophytonicola KI4 TaxID=2874699 RepID=A0A964BLU7_9CYAN|nr:TVP38/TMEM64 family protein [Waterburya agarophytonicola]MCC0175774.1 TVP38/TMEM64 family protein [Waterburya agarophytonicola KI4]